MMMCLFLAWAVSDYFCGVLAKGGGRSFCTGQLWTGMGYKLSACVERLARNVSHTGLWLAGICKGMFLCCHAPEGKRVTLEPPPNLGKLHIQPNSHFASSRSFPPTPHL